MSALRTITVGIVGPGRVGSALARGLSAAGYQIAGIASRSPGAALTLAAICHVPACEPQQVLASADLTILAVPDDELVGLAERLADQLVAEAPRAIVHCSGALSAAPLAPLAALGWQIGGLHPLQSFATTTTNLQPGITWGIEASPPLQATLIQLVEALDGQPLILCAEDKTLYHAAAVLACNYALTLVDAALSLLGLCAIPADRALQALLPLLHGNLATLERVGLPAALTGPLVRGDAGTVARHLAALDQRAPAIANLYRSLGTATLPLAHARGVDYAQLQALTRLMLQEAPNASVD